MRSLIIVAAAFTLVGCSAQAEPTKSDDAANPPTTASADPPESSGAAPPAGDAGAAMPAAPAPACSGAGIAAYADALVTAARTSCTSDGVGVVRNDNYQCMKTAIDSVAPAYPDMSYSIVTTLLAPNQQYPNLECTYFIQMVTSGVCGTPLSPSDMAWTDYPYAYEFIDKAPAGWTWFPNNSAAPRVEVGDIFVYDSTGGQDPGHIMIVAEVMGAQFRIAEANELNSNGSPATRETGVVSNTRVTSLTDPDERPAGWFRVTPK